MKKYYTIIILLLLQLLFSEIITGKIIGVTDGDTVKLLKDKTVYIIRLDGVDCPEKNQEYGTKAKQFTSDFCFGKFVNADISTKDRYDRFIAKIYLKDGKCLNKELLRAGMAWHYKHYNKEKELAKLEQYAKDNKIGLWKDKKPVPPWDFRKGSRDKSDSNEAVINAKYVGSVNSNKFHKPTCRWAKKISKKNLIKFKSIKDAEKKGYKPCKVCNH